MSEQMKAIGAEFEDSLQDAKDITAFLHDVACLRSVSGDETSSVLPGCSPWQGLVLVHEMLAEKLQTMSECYYGTSRGE
ncbi:MAG: hypothetical protein K6F46_09990 [Desulfovibrio sp.]|nr:hypothetical protein [Desulfovibrio sp.]